MADQVHLGEQVGGTHKRLSIIKTKIEHKKYDLHHHRAMLSGRAGGGIHYVADNASRQGAFRGHGMCVSSFCHSFIQSLAGIYVLGGSYYNSGEREEIQKMENI